MLIERPPRLMRALLPSGIFRMPHHSSPSPARGDGGKGSGRKVYLTFDDGPIPEMTPWVLDLLDRYGIKATFFMVGDNVRKYPHLYREVLRRGHRVGNHTMHHLQGLQCSSTRYLRDVAEAAELIDSDLFRPPHGWLKWRQARALRSRYRIIMYDLVTRDYSKWLTADDVVGNVQRYARPGSIIVFHDSLKSRPRLIDALPRCIEWLQSKGYEFELIGH